MPNMAIKIRKTKDGEGTIYKLEPPMNTEGGAVEYVIYKHLPVKSVIDGFMAWPAVTSLIAAVQTETGYKTKYALFARSYENQKLTAQKMLSQIGYSTK